MIMDGNLFDWNFSSFDASILPEAVHVGLLGHDKFKGCLHGIIRLLVQDAELNSSDLEYDISGSIGSVSPHFVPSRQENAGSTTHFAPEVAKRGINVIFLHDKAGMTIVCGKAFFSKLRSCGISALCSWAPFSWRAFEIHLGSAGEDSERLISHISTRLSDNKISILNFSTFASDLILVQDFQLDEAQGLFAEFARYGVQGMLDEIAEKSDDAHGIRADLPDRSPSENLESNPFFSLKSKYGAYLKVLAPSLELVSVQRAQLKESMFAIIKQILKNVDRADVYAMTNQQGSSLDTTDVSGDDFFWAYLSVQDEISLIVENDTVADFPSASLIECPQRWKAVKLCGRDIPFNEVGIVKTMMKPYEVGVQLLNMSTYATNVTLVAEEAVDIAVKKICESF